MGAKHILVVDDEEGVRSLLSRSLGFAGFRVTVAADGAEALTLMKSEDGDCAPVDLLLTDFDMPHVTGLEVIDTLALDGSTVPVLMMSGNQDEALVFEAYKRGCAGFLKKPFDRSLLLSEVQRALNSASAAAGNFCE